MLACHFEDNQWWNGNGSKDTCIKGIVCIDIAVTPSGDKHGYSIDGWQGFVWCGRRRTWRHWALEQLYITCREAVCDKDIKRKHCIWSIKKFILKWNEDNVLRELELLINMNQRYWWMVDKAPMDQRILIERCWQRRIDSSDDKWAESSTKWNAHF